MSVAPNGDCTPDYPLDIPIPLQDFDGDSPFCSGLERLKVVDGRAHELHEFYQHRSDTYLDNPLPGRHTPETFDYLLPDSAHDWGIAHWTAPDGTAALFLVRSDNGMWRTLTPIASKFGSDARTFRVEDGFLIVDKYDLHIGYSSTLLSNDEGKNWYCLPTDNVITDNNAP